MYISLNKILKHPAFAQAQVLAGREGAFRTVKRVSVYDCPIHDDVIESRIIEAGDFFISSLAQFEEETNQLLKLVRMLDQANCSGLCIVTTEKKGLITEEVKTFCSDSRFPIILIEEDVPYAYIMDAINRFIAIDNLNAMNELKLERILHTGLSESERMELLYSINKNIEPYLQVIFFNGEIQSELIEVELNLQYLSSREDIFVNSKRLQVLILSGGDKHKLQVRTDIAREQLMQNLTGCILGISRIYRRTEIHEALKDAKSALLMAKATGIPVQEYDPMSAMQLLILLRDRRELKEYYGNFINMISVHVSGDSLTELLKTVETYVITSGDFKRTGQLVGQHENTVRYRINKIKSYLNLEQDVIKFHETISLAVKIGLLLKED